MDYVLRPYDAIGDSQDAFGLWSACLGDTWPLDEEVFARHARAGTVAVHDERLVGLALLQVARGVAAIVALLVHPDAQGRGVGRTLHDAAFEEARRAGAARIKSGGLGGSGHYFWPGVPANLPRGGRFFRRQGWELPDRAWDLVRDLGSYHSPPQVMERARAAGITCRLAEPDELPAAVRFEEEHFPQWVAYFRATRDHREVVLATDERRAIQGTLLVERPERGPLWSRVLGKQTGGIGAVGVASAARERGAGTAMVAYACEVLRQAGTRNCLIGWTTRLGFYGRLGFQPWQEYAMGWRDL